MNRNELVRPFQQSVVDFNGAEALIAMGEDVRPYPRYFPIPFHAIASSDTDWTFEPFRRNLNIFPELYFVLGRDVAMDEENIGEDAILGYGVGLCVLDDALYNSIVNGTPRDLGEAYFYTAYADDTHILLPEIYPIKSAKGISVKISSPTLGERVFDQDKLRWDALKLLNAMSPLNAARKYDLVILGAADAPVKVPMDVRFAENEVITVDAGALGTSKVTVHDLRSEDTKVVTWKPRPLVCDPEYLDVN